MKKRISVPVLFTFILMFVGTALLFVLRLYENTLRKETECRERLSLACSDLLERSKAMLPEYETAFPISEQSEAMELICMLTRQESEAGILYSIRAEAAAGDIKEAFETCLYVPYGLEVQP